MTPKLAAGLLALIPLTIGCATAESPPPTYAAPVLPYEISELRHPVERLAFEIHSRDIAAWRATDRAIASGFDLQQEGVRGWIVILEGSDALVRFVGDGPSGPLALFDVRVDVATNAPGVVSRHESGVPLAETEASMWRARQLAASSGYRACSDRYNTVVLRDPDSENWLVYLLAATQGSDVMVGGHHRFLVSPRGDRILEATPLSASCLTANLDPGTEVFVFTQNASEEPLETSVLLSLQFDVPVFFRVPHGSVWLAAQGHLTRVREGPGE